MRPHPRIRKTIKWGGAAVTLLLLVVWIGSGWRIEEGGDGRVVISLSKGVARLVFLKATTPRVPREWHGRTVSRWELRAGLSWFETPAKYVVDVPLWAPAVPPFVGTCVAWRRDVLARRRARLNLCPKCHYDRAGIAKDAKCPECGGAAAR